MDEILATQLVSGPIAVKSETPFRQVSPPLKVDHKLALPFQSQVMQIFTANPHQWYKRERAQLLEDRALQNGGKRYTSSAPASGLDGTRPYKQALKNGGVRKTRFKIWPKSSRKDYNSIPDFCPPLDSLSKQHNLLKVKWKGGPINLDDDPDAHLLHKDEILLAATLRLDCATYLTSKRRIFVSRLKFLESGTEFRIIESQRACNINVNKASKLWQAFKEVGWLDPHWMHKYMTH
ncbi:Homeodomain-like protein [Bisporella sp. PMI_857]|nr:Homeodomain-like protein [Bisporella sp. PMI_857]